MTREEKWLGGKRPYLMLRLLPGAASERKLRLFACACVRRVWHLLGDARSRQAVELAERYADGRANAAHVSAFRGALWSSWGAEQQRELALLNMPEDSAGNPAATPAECARVAAEQTLLPNVQRAIWAADNVAWALGNAQKGPGYDKAREAECDLLRCIFGNPFHKATLDEAVMSWNGHLVRGLATALYDDRRFEDLPILADALEEAGCADFDLLAHCRAGGAHARGCWAVDLILGKG